LKLNFRIFEEMLKVMAIILITFFFTLCNAQLDSLNKHNVKLSSNSSVIYPEISTGIEFPVRHFNLSEARKANKTWFISGNLSWYHHPGFHDNLYATVEWVMRRTKTIGFCKEFSLGPGFSRTFLGGTTYKVDENGIVSVVKLAGYYYALFNFGGGIGYDFSVMKQKPFSLFSKMDMILMFPYNSTLYFRPIMELDIRYNTGQPLKKLWGESD
jgi:hypothetical protein